MFSLLAATVQDPPKVQVLVLERGETRVLEADRERLQAEHLKFLEGLWTDGPALAVGPLLDGGDWRGLVLLDVESPEEAIQAMRGDPLVARKALACRVFTWHVDPKRFNKGSRFMDLTGYTFVRFVGIRQLEPTPCAPPAAKAFGVVSGSTDVQAFAIFEPTPKLELDSMLKAAGLVGDGGWTAKPFQWLTAKGLFDPK